MKLYRTSDYWLIEQADITFRLSRFDFDAWLASENPVAYLHHLVRTLAPSHVPVPGPGAALLPIGSQEIWAAGVTYVRSKVARMEESQSAKNAYDLVYDAPRPEIFFKATPSRCRQSGQPIRLRDDAKWIVPEPELALVLSARGQIVGYTIGNDVSCRDIEGENLLYLPQAKIWDGCCALGPCILLSDPAHNILAAPILLTILRDGQAVFTGSTSGQQIKRPLEELVGYLFRNQSFPAGAVLLTGTGIIPPADFSLRRGDIVRIQIDGIGVLDNPVA